MSWSTVPEALAEIRAGRPLVVTDAPDRENEADLVVAAELATPEVVNFMVTHGRGLVCVPMEASRLAKLELSLMVTNNTTPNGTAFTVPVDVREGTTTGISAFERARTIRALIDPSTQPGDLLRPGHMFPLRAHPGGLKARAGHTEAAVELARLAGLYPAGVVCEILAEDGTMARGAGLEDFADQHGLRRLAIADLVAWLAAGEEVAAATKTEERGAPAPIGGTPNPIAALAAGD